MSRMRLGVSEAYLECLPICHQCGCGSLRLRVRCACNGADVSEGQLQGKMLQQMRVLEEAGMRFTEKPLTALSTMGGDGGFLHAKQASSGTILELVLDGFLHPKEARRCDFILNISASLWLAGSYIATSFCEVTCPEIFCLCCSTYPSTNSMTFMPAVVPCKHVDAS